MANQYKDKLGHFTFKRNDGGECLHRLKTSPDDTPENREPKTLDKKYKTDVRQLVRDVKNGIIDKNDAIRFLTENNIELPSDEWKRTYVDLYIHTPNFKKFMNDAIKKNAINPSTIYADTVQIRESSNKTLDKMGIDFFFINNNGDFRCVDLKSTATNSVKITLETRNQDDPPVRGAFEKPTIPYDRERDYNSIGKIPGTNKLSESLLRNSFTTDYAFQFMDGKTTTVYMMSKSELDSYVNVTEEIKDKLYDRVKQTGKPIYYTLNNGIKIRGTINNGRYISQVVISKDFLENVKGICRLKR